MGIFLRHIILALAIVGAACCVPAAAQSRPGAMKAKSASTVKAHGSWAFACEMTSDVEGVATMTLDIDPGWHVYGEKIGGVGPVALDFRLEGTGGVELLGSPQATPTASGKIDDTFGFEVTYYEGKVAFRQRFRLDKPASPAIKGDIIWQTCSGTTCTRPNTTTVNIPVDITKK